MALPRNPPSPEKGLHLRSASANFPGNRLQASFWSRTLLPVHFSSSPAQSVVEPLKILLERHTKKKGPLGDGVKTPARLRGAGKASGSRGSADGLPSHQLFAVRSQTLGAIGSAGQHFFSQRIVDGLAKDVLEVTGTPLAASPQPLAPVWAAESRGGATEGWLSYQMQTLTS
jgi:hypothetical protein